MHASESDALVTFTIGEDVKTGDCLKIDLASGKVVLARSESYDLVAWADWRVGQVVALPFEFKPNTKSYGHIRSRLSVAFASCLEYCMSGERGDPLDKLACEAWTKVVEDLITEVTE